MWGSQRKVLSSKVREGSKGAVSLLLRVGKAKREWESERTTVEQLNKQLKQAYTIGPETVGLHLQSCFLAFSTLALLMYAHVRPSPAD